MGIFLKRKAGSDTWLLTVDVWKGGKRSYLYPPRTRYAQYGLDPEDSYDQAMVKIKAVRAKDKIEKNIQKRARIEKRVEIESLKESAYLPRRVYSDFIEWLKDRRLWGEIPLKERSHLLCMRKMVLELDMDPSEWPDKPEKVFRWFLTNKLSLSYIKKVLPLLNDYGYFYCKLFKKPYLQVKMPIGDIARKIDDANYNERKGRQAASAPLTPALLQKLSGLPDEQFRWMRLTMWFGFRPIEVDQLTESKRPKIWDVYQDEKGTWIIAFFQSKLINIERARRWKRIPAIHVEQVNLLNELKAGMRAKRPLLKTIEARLGGQFGTYSGRKGFEALMHSLKQSPRNVSRWLGHQNIKQTDQNYREIERVEYDLAGP